MRRLHLSVFASLSLVALALALPRTPRVEDPLACPYCGGSFTFESMTASLGGQLLARVTQLYAGH